MDLMPQDMIVDIHTAGVHTDVYVKITHIPTGYIEEETASSQWRAKVNCITRLKERLNAVQA